MPLAGMLKAVLYSIPLLLRAPVWYMRLWYARWRAMRCLASELTKQGIPEEDSMELSRLYPDILELARALGGERAPVSSPPTRG